MSEAQDKEKKTLSLGGKGTLSLKGGPAANAAPPAAPRQNVPHGRGKTVSVEVRRKRSFEKGPEGDEATDLSRLTSEEREHRLRALRDAEEASRRRASEGPAREESRGGFRPKPDQPLSDREREIA